MAKPQLAGVVQQLNRLFGLRAADGSTDAELLQAFAASRDEAAFAELARRHGRTVWGACLRVLDNRHDAEDAFQAVWMVLARKAGSLRKPQLLGNWLYGVAFRIASKAKAQASQRRALEKKALDMLSADETCERDWQELRPMLDEEVNRLPEKYRAPIILCYFEGKGLRR